MYQDLNCFFKQMTCFFINHYNKQDLEDLFNQVGHFHANCINQMLK